MSESNASLTTFDTPQELANGLARSLAETLRDAIAEKGAASMAVSGGSTPKLLFEALAQEDVDWSVVTITLVDDRCVPPDNERSNELLVRRHLMQNWAAPARFLPLQNVETDSLAALLPLDVCILGMGTDGHTASFFSGGDTLSQATDPNQIAPVIHLSADSASEERVTMTLPVLVSAKRLVLHIEGAAKRKVLDRAHKGGAADTLPIRHVLRAREDIEIFWAP